MFNSYIDYNDARECVFVIYEKRGYISACEFIQMLNGYDLISLENRTNLTTFITMYEEEKLFKKKQKRIANKIRKNLK